MLLNYNALTVPKVTLSLLFSDYFVILHSAEFIVWSFGN